MVTQGKWQKPENENVTAKPRLTPVKPGQRNQETVKTGKAT